MPDSIANILTFRLKGSNLSGVDNHVTAALSGADRVACKVHSIDRGFNAGEFSVPWDAISAITSIISIWIALRQGRKEKTASTPQEGEFQMENISEFEDFVTTTTKAKIAVRGDAAGNCIEIYVERHETTVTIRAASLGRRVKSM